MSSLLFYFYFFILFFQIYIFAKMQIMENVKSAIKLWGFMLWEKS